MPRLVKDAKSGIYFFRWLLPKNQQQNLQRKSLYISLRTRDFRLAQCHAALMNLRVEKMKKIPDLNEAGIRELLKIDLERGIFEADTPEGQERGLRALEALGKLRDRGEHSSPGGAVIATPPTGKHTANPKSPLFKKVADEVIAELSLTLKSSSIYKYKTSYDAFLAFLSNRFLEDISRDDIKRFKDKFIEKGKVPHTINGYLGKLQFLFEFAIKNKYLKGENPAENFQIPHSKKVVNPRDKFYDDDLKAIYNWETYQRMAITPDYFWGPLVCLFSGMRIEECTSLEVRNVKVDDGVVIMHVKDAKTPTGVRYVPIHSYIIKLGFLDYVERVRELGHDMLFWYLSDGALGALTNHNGTKKNLSRHFSKYLEKVQVKQDDNCFHSLRHTTITRLAGRRINNSTIYKLSGHTSDNSAHYDYLHDLPVKTLKEAVEELDFHELLDLSAFDWKPSLQKLLAREVKRAKTAEAKRQRDERTIAMTPPKKKWRTVF